MSLSDAEFPERGFRPNPVQEAAGSAAEDAPDASSGQSHHDDSDGDEDDLGDQTDHGQEHQERHPRPESAPERYGPRLSRRQPRPGWHR